MSKKKNVSVRGAFWIWPRAIWVGAAQMVLVVKQPPAQAGDLETRV